MPERPTIFTNTDDLVEANEERRSIFADTQPVQVKTKPERTEDLSRIDDATGQAIDAIFSQVEPQQGSYINSPEFRQLFLKFAYGSEDLSDEEKRQISLAMDLYPPLRLVAQSLADSPRPEATMSAITNEQAEKGLRSYEKMMAENVDAIQEEDFAVSSGGSIQSKWILPVLFKALRGLQGFTDEFMSSISSRNEQGQIPLEVQFQEVMREIGLEAIDPDDAFFEFENPKTGVIDKVPMTKGQIFARNLLKGVARLPGDIIIGHVRDPVGFYLALPDFAFGEVDLVVQAAFGQDIILDEETGQVAFRAISEEEQEQANKDFLMNPHAPMMALALFAGMGLKGSKTGKVLANRRVVQALSRRAKKVEAELVGALNKLEEAVQARVASDKRAAEKEERSRPLILDESLGELKAIEKASEGELRSELLAMQENVVSKRSAVEIAKMPIEEVQFVLSRGELGREPGTVVTLPEARPGTDKLPFQGEAELVKGDVRPSGEAGATSTEAVARLKSQKAAGDRVYRVNIRSGKIEELPATVDRVDIQPGGNEVIATLRDGKVVDINRNPGIKLSPEELKKKVAGQLSDVPKPTVKTKALTEPEQVAQALGIKYDGQFTRKDGSTIETFTDPKTGSTINADNLSEIPKKVQESRVKFAEAKLQREKAKAESDRLEAERRERELATDQKETDPEVLRLKLEIAEIQDKISEQQEVQKQFREALPFADKASKKNIEAAIKSIDEAILGRKVDIGKKVDELTEARRRAEAPVEETETKAADAKVDETTDAEAKIIEEDGSTKTAEEQKDKTDKRKKAVEERRKAEEKTEELEEEREDEIDNSVDETQHKTKSPDEPTPVTQGLFEGKKQFVLVKLSELKVNLEKFQGRFEEYSEKSVNSIIEAVKSGKFDPDNFDPIHIWRDPVSGESFVLAGHSRLEALKRLGHDEAPVIYRDFKTEAEAIRYATELSNYLTEGEGLRAEVSTYRKMRERGVSTDELKGRFGENVNYYDAFSHLDPTGKIMDIIEQRVFEDFPHAKKWARTIGELRKEYSQLTNAHEKQIWDQLYPTDRATGLYDKLNKAEVGDMIQAQVTDAFWTQETPIKLRRDPKPMTGERARKDTGPLVQKIADLEALIHKLSALDEPNVKQIESIKKQIRKTRDAIGEIMGSQMGFELGFFGTPQAAIDAWISADRALRATGGYLGKILKRTEMAPELRGGFEGALESMKQHHRNLNNAKFYEQVMAHQFDQLIPNKARRQLIMDMLQIEQPQAYANYLKKEKGIIIDPTEFSKDKLTPLEQGVLEWLKKERDQVEKFKIDNDLVTPKKLPPGVAYAFQWWMNPETGKPYGIEYGRYTKSLPQSKERSFNTYLEGRLAGKEMATDNVGFIIGKDFETAMRAHAGRELYKTLHQIELGTGEGISMSPEIAHGIIPGEAGVRPAMFLENWLTIKESALAEQYVRVDVPYLEKPVSFTVKMEGVDFNYPLFPEYSKKIRNKKITLQGPIAVHESIAPWVKAYFDKPTYNMLTKTMMFAKSMKLAGIFHATQLTINDLMMLRNPIGDIIRARKLKYNLSDPALQLLVEEGLRIEGFDDLGWDPVEQLRFEGKGKGAAILNNAVLGPVRGLAKFTFHTVGNNLKVAMAYDQFLKLLPKWEKKVGPELSMEQARRRAAREAVVFSDRLFSHEDFRMAMLESGKAMVNFYYSTTARTTLHSLLISPQWQKQHIMAFAEGVKSLNPVQIIKDIKNGSDTPSANLYRRYMAGIGASFAIMDMYNYAMTQYMDGEGKHNFENPEGHGFHVRAPWNNPDGTTAWIRPFKTAFEVPEAIVALLAAGKNIGQSIMGDEVEFDAAKLGKFTNKMNPWFASFFANFKFDVDAFGNKIYEKRGLADRIADFVIDVYEPITLSQFAEVAKRHKAPIGAVLSLLGFPVSKGYPGGPWNKELHEFMADIRLDREEILTLVDDKIVAAMNGDDGAMTSALLIMSEQLRMGNKAKMGRFQKFWNPLIKSYDNLGRMDRQMWYLHLQETGQLEEFLEAIAKDAGN